MMRMATAVLIHAFLAGLYQAVAPHQQPASHMLLLSARSSHLCAAFFSCLTLACAPLVTFHFTEHCDLP